MSFSLSNIGIPSILAVSPLMPAELAVSHSSKIESLSQIITDLPQHTLFLFDIDDTLFDSSYMLGSRAWRRYIVEASKKFDSSENWHDIFSYALAQKHPLKSVEEMTSEFVKGLQDKGYVVCGFTSRERNCWYDRPQDGVDQLTIEQLHSVKINFNNKSLETKYPYLSTDTEFFKGVFFANVEPKGKYLLNLLGNAPELPKKVVFVDDKSSQVESVADALASMKIPYDCYTYTATEEKTKAFDPLIASVELYHFYESEGQTIISDQQALGIIKENPEKDADYYLQATLEIAKSRLVR